MPGEESLRDAVIQDFDRIAASAQPTWNHNIHYYPLLLRQLPAQLTRVLDVGCGNGDLVRRIAARASRVEGLDFSPGMITTARALTPPTQYPQVHYACADVMDTALDAGSYDAIVSVATIHHLPLEACLAKFHAALKPDGVLVLLDLYQPQTVGDILLSLAAVPVNWLLHFRHCGRLREDAMESALWAAHGQHDRYAPISEITAHARAVFPTIHIRRLLLWRYLLIARKDAKLFNCIS